MSSVDLSSSANVIRWARRIALALLLILVPSVALAWYGRGLVLWQQVALYTAQSIFTLGVLYWLLIGRSPFGPILFYDLLRSARHGRHALFRCLYLAALLFMLFLLYVNWFSERYGGTGITGAGQRLSPSDSVLFAQKFFETYVAVQFVVIVLLTPGCTAGAIAEEKDRKTMEYLLTSDLLPLEIVLGKLTSRLAYLTLLLLTGLPVLGILQLLGGVDPQLVIAAFTATALTMLSLACLSILNSVLCVKPRTAILVTYIEAALYLAVVNVLYQVLGRGYPWSQWIDAGNIVSTISRLKLAQAGGADLAVVVPALLLDYALFHGAVAIGCLILATACFRFLCKWQIARRARRSFIITFMPRRRPRVRSEPMLWKEMYVEPMFRFGRTSMAIAGALIYGLLILGGFALLVLFMLGVTLGDLDEAMNQGVRWLGTPIACLMLVGIALRSSSAFSSERDRQTFDSLLSSPLSNEAIIRAKWLGSLLSVRRLGWYLLAIWLVGALTGGLHWLALPLLVGAWFIYAAFMSSLGLIFSLFCRNTMRATICTLVTLVALSGGHWLCGLCCTPLMAVSDGRVRDTDSSEWMVEFQKYGLTPPFTLSLFAFYEKELDYTGSSEPSDSGYSSYERRPTTFTCGRLMAAFFGLGGYAVAAWVLWAIASENFTRITGRMPLPADLVQEERARMLRRKAAKKETVRS